MSLYPKNRSRAKPVLVVVLVALGVMFLLGFVFQRYDSDVSGLRSAIAERLALMPDVARHKWNTGTAIADPAREQRLIEASVVKGRQFGIPDQVTRAAIEAQINASKQMQEELMRAWSEVEQGKFASVPKFVEETRPKIDAATDRLIRELGKAIHVLPTCTAATALREPPADGLVSGAVWSTAVEGLLQSESGPSIEACSSS